MKTASLIISAMLVAVLLSGCSLFPRRTFDKKLGNNPEAADCARAWQKMKTREGFPQRWHVRLKPAKGGEVRGKALEQYREKVTDVEVEVELAGTSRTDWQKAIEQKKKLPNPYLSWPDQWLETTAKELASPQKAKRIDKMAFVYPKANVTLTLIVNGKVGAIARYDAATKTSSVEIHY